MGDLTITVVGFHGTEHPHGTQDIPAFIVISTTVLNIPMVLKISATVKSVQSTLSHLITTSVPSAMFTHFLVEHGLSQYHLY